jgi:hypothetical protein
MNNILSLHLWCYLLSTQSEWNHENTCTVNMYSTYPGRICKSWVLIWVTNFWDKPLAKYLDGMAWQQGPLFSCYICVLSVAYPAYYYMADHLGKKKEAAAVSAGTCTPHDSVSPILWSFQLMDDSILLVYISTLVQLQIEFDAWISWVWFGFHFNLTPGPGHTQAT